MKKNKKEKREIFIHVGLPKTGTTWLQEYFYPKLDLTLITTKKDFESIPEKGKILISREHLSGINFPVDFRYYFAHGLKSVYPDAKIILGLREKNKWLRAFYNQNVKRGLIDFSYDEWLKRFDMRLCDFDDYVKLLNDLFDDVFVYWFEDFKTNKKEVLSDLCKFLDVDFPSYKDGIINPGSYGLSENFLLFYNKICKKFRKFINFFFIWINSLNKKVKK